MNAEDGPSLIWGLVAIALLVSSLAARRLPLGQVAKMVLAWTAVFAALFVIFSFRPEIKAVWNRVTSDLAGTAGQTVSGKAIALTRRDDGHYWVRAKVNGRDLDFMIDSGATLTSIGAAAAKETGIEVDSSGFPVVINTANGSVSAHRANIASMQIETLSITDHHAVVSDAFGDTNVLGMNFLDSLRSWNVEGDVMTLQP